MILNNLIIVVMLLSFILIAYECIELVKEQEVRIHKEQTKVPVCIVNFG